MSLPSVRNHVVFTLPRDNQNRNSVSEDRASVLSSDSESSVDNLEETIVRKPYPESRGWNVASIFRIPRPTRTSSAFQRWKVKQRRPVRKLLLFAITASIAVMLVVSAMNSSSTLLTHTSSVLTSLLIYYIIHLKSLIPSSDIEKRIASWGLSGYPAQPVITLPADFSRDIVPIPCHSHNDYWRRVPLYDALAAGCISVEADVWLSGNDNDLLVGHSEKSLTKERTLNSLYVDPLVSILTSQNNRTTTAGAIANTTQLNGIFEVSLETRLTLLIDIKTDGASTFLAVLEHLEPLRSRGWLTHFNGAAIVPGLITVVGTGNTPFDLLIANTTHRDIFYDAPLEELWGDNPFQDDKRLLVAQKYSSENSYYASVSFQEEIGGLWHGMLTPQQVLKIRGQVKGAELRGLKARYWDTPAWPVGRRDHVWDVLMREGVGSLNVDDLEAAKDRNWGG